MTLTHRERMQACLANDPSLDRPPVALWRHFPVDDQDPETLAASTLDFQRRYDFEPGQSDPSLIVSIKDWGAETYGKATPRGHAGTSGALSASHRTGNTSCALSLLTHLARQLACLRIIRADLPAETPLLQTIFSPLAQAKNLVVVTGCRSPPPVSGSCAERLEASPRQRVALSRPAWRLAWTVSLCCPARQAGLLTLDEYKTFGLPNDLKSLEPAGSLWCNLLHLHGLDIYFDLVAQSLFPDTLFPIVNWHDRETGPSLAEGFEAYPVQSAVG